MEKANPFLSEIVNTCEKNAEKVPTLRFTLSLTESNDKSCPEFSFLDLIKKAPADENKEKTPFEDDGETENLRALAKKFEEKYAPRPRSRKRRLDRVEDLVDVTYGYDETDPFVDDSEAYDELIPADWTTEHGGFYINQGELNFRPASSDESEVDDDFKEVKKVKHKSPKKLPKIPKVKKVKVPGVKKEKKKLMVDKEKKPKKISSGEKVKDKEKKPKKKHVVGNASVFNQMLSPSSGAKTTVVSPTACSNVATPSSASILLLTNSGVTSNSPPAKLQNTLHLGNQGTLKSEPVTVSLNGGSGTPGVESTLNVQSETVIGTLLNSPIQNGLQSTEGSSVESSEPKLPQCLPTDVESCIMRLKQAANDSVDEGKCKFFNSDVNHMLLELETKSRALSSKVRSGIYEFLAFYLPCTKETLLKRAKKLLLTDQAGRLREPMAKLKAAVDRVIPEQVKRFEEEVKRHVEEESQQSDAKLGGENSNDHKKELFKSAMELVEESEKMEDVTTPTDPNAPTLPEDKTKKSVPKRKFLWTDELRELLCAVVQMKLKVFEMSKTRIMSAEEYLKQFFEEEVRPLWPKGWMTSRILFKESKQAHGKHTAVPARIYKKAMLPKKQGESSENTDSSVGSIEVKDLPVTIPSVGSVGSSLANAVPTVSPTVITQASCAATNPSQLEKPPEVKASALTFASALTVTKPVATAASVTKMESTTVNRPEKKPQAVSVIAGLSFAEKDSSQKPSIKTPSLSESINARPVTILDLAEIMSAEAKGSSPKLLHSQPALPPQQQMAVFLKKTPPSPKENARDQPFTHLPSALVTTGISPVKQSMTMSSVQTQSPLPSTPKIVHSSPVVVQTNSQSGFKAASLVAAIGSGVHNSFIDLSSTIKPQQIPSASAAPQTILDTISPPRRPLDLKSCQAVHPSFSQGLSPQSISMSLNSAVPTQALHQPQPPNLTLFGSAANLQGKGTTPLTHIGLVPSTAMLHLARQSQEQAGLVLPQNHFNQVLLGMNQSSNQSMPSLPLSHGALLSNQTVYPDPNQTPTTGAHQSAFLPRFS